LIDSGISIALLVLLHPQLPLDERTNVLVLVRVMSMLGEPDAAEVGAEENGGVMGSRRIRGGRVQV
jgi:hypothetical protein